MIQFLNQYDIFVNAVCRSIDETALHFAATNDHFDIIKIFIEREINTVAKNFTNRTTFHFNIKKSNCFYFRFLFEQNNNVNFFENNDECNVHDINVDEFSPLHYAVNACSLKCIQFFVEYDSNVFSITQNDFNPLHFAMMSINMKRQKVIKFLINEKSNFFLARHDGITFIDIFIDECSAKSNFLIIEYDLTKLVQWKNPNSFGELNLSQNLLKLCQRDLTDRFKWLIVAFKTLLQNDANFTKKNETNETIFDVLLCFWLKMFFIRLNKNIMTLQWINNNANLIHIVLNHVFADIFFDSHYDLSNLLLPALKIRDELLTKKIFDFFLDVNFIFDCDDQKLSAIKTATLWNCNDTLFKFILNKFKTLLNSILISKIFARIIDNNLKHRTNVFFEIKLNFNNCFKQNVIFFMLIFNKRSRWYDDMIN